MSLVNVTSFTSGVAWAFAGAGAASKAATAAASNAVRIRCRFVVMSQSSTVGNGFEKLSLYTGRAERPSPVRRRPRGRV